MANNAWINVAKTSQVRCFAPILSPIRPRLVPMRNDNREQSACWSGLWKPEVDMGEGLNVLARARPN